MTNICECGFHKSWHIGFRPDGEGYNFALDGGERACKKFKPQSPETKPNEDVTTGNLQPALHVGKEDKTRDTQSIFDVSDLEKDIKYLESFRLTDNATWTEEQILFWDTSPSFHTLKVTKEERQRIKAEVEKVLDDCEFIFPSEIKELKKRLGIK